MADNNVSTNATPTLTEEQIAKIKEDAKAEAKRDYEKSLEELRKRDEREREKAKLSAEEKAKADLKDELDAKQAKLAEYEQRIKLSEISDAINANKLPARYKYDSRLLSATPEERANVIKTLVKEYGEETAGYQKATIQSTAPQTNPTGNGTLGGKTLEEVAKMSTQEYLEWRSKNKL